MNIVVMMGRLTRDPELKVLPGDKMLCNFSIAVKREFQKDKVDFVDCVAWGKTAELIATYFTKGAGIVIDGALQIDDYEKDGVKRKIAKVNVDRFKFPEGNRGKNEATFEDAAPIVGEDMPW